MTESDVYTQIAHYMNVRYPEVIYHFDLSGVNNPSRYTRNLYGRLNRRAYPDLFIAEPSLYYSEEGSVEKYNGMFVEVKKPGVKVFKKDGDIRADKHLQEQRQMLRDLSQRGYYTAFASGFEEFQALIDSYLKKEGDQSCTF